MNNLHNICKINVEDIPQPILFWVVHHSNFKYKYEGRKLYLWESDSHWIAKREYTLQSYYTTYYGKGLLITKIPSNLIVI